MGTNQDHTWQILDDILVFLAGRHVPTPERTYKLDGGWQLAKGDLQRYVIGIEAAIAKAISDRQDSDRKVMEADEALNRTKLQLAAAEKQRDDAQRIAKKRTMDSARRSRTGVTHSPPSTCCGEQRNTGGGRGERRARPRGGAGAAGLHDR